MATVFYSWQSDLEPSTNRNFIEDALEKALRQLAKDDEVYQPPREVDKDTAGVAGSPHIAATIFGKIHAASACVFDVSIVLRGESRASPNPNVLVELGYALKAHPDARVIMVMNTQTGEPEELPFDLRFRRVLKYAPIEVDGDRSKAKADLVRGFVAAFKATFAHNHANRFTRDEVEFFLLLYNNARAFLNLRAELDDREPYEDAPMNARFTAEALRELAAVDAAAKHAEVLVQLNTFCERLDEIAAWEPLMGGHHYQEFLTRMDAAKKEALPLLEAATDGMKQRLAGEDFAPMKRQVARRAINEFERLRKSVENRDASHLRAIRQALQETGVEVLRLAADLEVVGDADAQVFRPAGHVLNVATIEKSRENGFGDEERLIARLKPVLEPLARFKASNA